MITMNDEHRLPSDCPFRPDIGNASYRYLFCCIKRQKVCTVPYGKMSAFNDDWYSYFAISSTAAWAILFLKCIGAALEVEVRGKGFEGCAHDLMTLASSIQIQFEVEIQNTKAFIGLNHNKHTFGGIVQIRNRYNSTVWPITVFL